MYRKTCDKTNLSTYRNIVLKEAYPCTEMFIIDN